ncbi:MAG TPA: hypothetical protein VHX38_02005 [Pseudonocardiaceae bacterium]|jgi:hypothetical protein|nr:hypothetical protein [Pseudonocardiaceae bacterium]
MAELKWTALRHAMLRCVEVELVARGLGVSGWWINATVPGSYGHAERAVTSLVHAGLARIVGDYRAPLALTDEGQRVLISWNARHGKADTDGQ